MKLLQAFSVVSCSLGLLTLTGCGGGGSSTGTADDIAPFEPSSTAGTSTGFNVNDDGVEALGFTDSSATIEYDSDGYVQEVSVTTPEGTITWNGNDIVPMTENSVILTYSEGGSARGAFVDPQHAGFSYQTFGAWLTQAGDAIQSFEAITVGSPTQFDAIPGGTAEFSGYTLGHYYDLTSEEIFLTQSDLKLSANFENRNLQFETTNTKKSNLADSQGFTNAPDLNITNNTLSISAESNIFSGDLTTSNGLTGGAEGRFYGPNAEEAGGVFSLTSDDSAYVGSFGAKK